MTKVAVLDDWQGVGSGQHRLVPTIGARRSRLFSLTRLRMKTMPLESWQISRLFCRCASVRRYPPRSSTACPSCACWGMTGAAQCFTRHRLLHRARRAGVQYGRRRCGPDRHRGVGARLASGSRTSHPRCRLEHPRRTLSGGPAGRHLLGGKDDRDYRSWPAWGRSWQIIAGL